MWKLSGILTHRRYLKVGLNKCVYLRFCREFFLSKMSTLFHLEFEFGTRVKRGLRQVMKYLETKISFFAVYFYIFFFINLLKIFHYNVVIVGFCFNLYGNYMYSVIGQRISDCMLEFRMDLLWHMMFKNALSFTHEMHRAPKIGVYSYTTL